jgi:hypothetical protein
VQRECCGASRRVVGRTVWCGMGKPQRFDHPVMILLY